MVRNFAGMLISDQCKKCVNLVYLAKFFKMNTYVQMSMMIRPRTSVRKIYEFPDQNKPEIGAIDLLEVPVIFAGSNTRSSHICYR